MKAADLLTDDDFLDWCETWRLQGRAPLPGADWLEDRGLDGQARAWAWAAKASGPNTQSYMEELLPFRPRGGRGVDLGFWWYSPKPQRNYAAENVLPQAMRVGESRNEFATFPAAIAWFLDRWADVFGTNPTPTLPDEEVCHCGQTKEAHYWGGSAEHNFVPMGATA